MQLHSRACSPGCQIGSYRRCFPKSIVDARFPFTQKIPTCFLMHESSTPLPALLIKCDGCRILEGIWVDYCFLLHGVRFLIRNLQKSLVIAMGGWLVRAMGARSQSHLEDYTPEPCGLIDSAFSVNPFYPCSASYAADSSDQI